MKNQNWTRRNWNGLCLNGMEIIIPVTHFRIWRHFSKRQLWLSMWRSLDPRCSISTHARWPVHGALSQRNEGRDLASGDGTWTCRPYKMISTALMIERKLACVAAPKSSPTWQWHSNFQGIFSPSSLHGKRDVKFRNEYVQSKPEFPAQTRRNREGNKSENGLDGTNGNFLRGICNLSYQELMERRNKGLCFKCKQHYSPAHHSPDHHLKLLIWKEDDNEGPMESLLGLQDKEGQEDREMVWNVMSIQEVHSLDMASSRTMARRMSRRIPNPVPHW